MVNIYPLVRKYLPCFPFLGDGSAYFMTQNLFIQGWVYSYRFGKFEEKPFHYNLTIPMNLL